MTLRSLRIFTKNFLQKLQYFLVIDDTYAWDNPSLFKKNLSEKDEKLILTIDDMIRYGKLQYDVNREAAKISALSSEKVDIYEYLTDEEVLPCNPRQIIEQAKFTYPPLGTTFEKQTKTIEEQREKQIKNIEDQG